jgi:hypothetical protein
MKINCIPIIFLLFTDVIFAEINDSTRWVLSSLKSSIEGRGIKKISLNTRFLTLSAECGEFKFIRGSVGAIQYTIYNGEGGLSMELPNGYVLSGYDMDYIVREVTAFIASEKLYQHTKVCPKKFK